MRRSLFNKPAVAEEDLIKFSGLITEGPAGQLRYIVGVMHGEAGRLNVHYLPERRGSTTYDPIFNEEKYLVCSADHLVVNGFKPLKHHHLCLIQ